MPGNFRGGIFSRISRMYTTRENKNSEDMGVVASKRHVDSRIDYGVIVSLLQARYCCSKPTRSTIFKCPFFCH